MATLAFSKSGDSEELADLLPAVKRLGIPVVALTASPRSLLGRAADVTIDVSVDSGTCPDSVRSDALERVRRWDWDVGIGREVPLRVVLRFDPPRR